MFKNKLITCFKKYCCSNAPKRLRSTEVAPLHGATPQACGAHAHVRPCGQRPDTPGRGAQGSGLTQLRGWTGPHGTSVCVLLFDTTTQIKRLWLSAATATGKPGPRRTALPRSSPSWAVKGPRPPAWDSASCVTRGAWVAGHTDLPSVDTLRYTMLTSPCTHLKSLNHQGHGDGCEFLNIYIFAGKFKFCHWWQTPLAVFLDGTVSLPS